MVRKAPYMFAWVLLVGCGDVFAFPVEASVDEFTVPGDPVLNHDRSPISADAVPPIEIAIPTSGISGGSVSLAALEFERTDTALTADDDDGGDDLTFLTGLEVFLESSDPAAGLPTLLVAHWTGAPTRELTGLELNVEDQYDLSPYLAAGFRLLVRPRGVVPYDDVSLKGTVRFIVNPL